jgi:YegS/Rv2252/BmrU family lipid kinase
VRSLDQAGVAVIRPEVDSLDAMRAHLAAAAAESDPARRVDAVVVGGGDGTLNGLAESLVEAGLPLGILPLGTANDLARTLAIPTDPAAAGAVVAGGWRTAVDLGRARWEEGGGKLYFNVASIGAAVSVAQTMHRRRERNRRWGVLSYPLALAEAAWACRPFKIDLRVDDHREVLRAYQVSVGNGVYYGGGMTIAADAAIDDGALDVYVVKHQPSWRVFVHLPVLRRGRHDLWTGVRHLRGREVTLRPRRRMTVNTDGELAGRAPAVFDVLRGALAVFVPEAAAGDGVGPPRETEEAMSEPGWTALRSDAEVALDDVTVGCKRTAEHLADAAALVAEEAPDLAALFSALATDRAALAEELERRMLEMDSYPGAPDDDREMVGHLARRLRHALSSHDEEALLDDRLRESEDLATDISTARARDDVPPQAQAVLGLAQERVAADIARLRAAGDGRSGGPEGRRG